MDESGAKRQRTGSNIENSTCLEIIINGLNNNVQQNVILQCNQEETMSLTSKSEYLAHLINEFGGMTTINRENEISKISLQEDNPKKSQFLVELMYPTSNQLQWNKNWAILSGKWIIIDYISKFLEISEKFFESYKISDDYVTIEVFSSDGKTSNDYYCRKGEKYVNEIDSDFEIKRTAPNSLNWSLYIKNEIKISSKEQLKQKPLLSSSGIWFSKTKDIIAGITLEKSKPKIKQPIDKIIFCEIVEVYLSHACYSKGSITSIDDLLTYLHKNKCFAIPEVLNRLLSKEDLIQLTQMK